MKEIQKKEHESLMKQTGKQLEKLIANLGFEYQKDFTEKLGVSPSRLSNYVNARSLPDYDFFHRLKKIYPEIVIDDFFKEGEPTMTKSRFTSTTVQDDKLLEKYISLLEKYNSLLDKCK